MKTCPDCQMPVAHCYCEYDHDDEFEDDEFEDERLEAEEFSRELDMLAYQLGLAELT